MQVGVVVGFKTLCIGKFEFIIQYQRYRRELRQHSSKQMYLGIMSSSNIMSLLHQTVKNKDAYRRLVD